MILSLSCASIKSLTINRSCARMKERHEFGYFLCDFSHVILILSARGFLLGNRALISCCYVVLCGLLFFKSFVILLESFL
jgi:hypothetical protein